MKGDPKMNGKIMEVRIPGDEAGYALWENGVSFRDVDRACDLFFKKRKMIHLFRYSFGSIKGIGEKSK